MKLANTGGFVDGIRQGPLDTSSSRNRRDDLGSAWVFDEFSAHPKARSKLSEPVLRDRDQDLMSLSDRAFTDPPPARPDWMEGSDRLLEQRLLAASRIRSFGTPTSSTSTDTQRQGQVNASQALLAGQSVGLKSLGSAQHPNNCTECYFHTFSSNGCTAGAYCSFCHEPHTQRKQPKRNRRIRKQNSQANNTGNDSVEARSVSNQSIGSGVVLVPNAQRQQLSLMDDAQSRQIAAMQQLTMEHVSSKMSSAQSVSESEKTSSSRRGKSEFVRFRYLDRDDSDVPILLTVIVGVGVHFPAVVEMDLGKKAALKDYIQFMVEPPLPEGMSLHRVTGLISGTPAKAQDGASVHHVTINTEATGPGGISLGVVAMASCAIAVRVIDGRGYVLSWAEDQADDGGTHQQILLKLQKC